MWKWLWNYCMQVGMALDRFLNAFLFFGYAGETMSARIFRGWRRRRIAGTVLMIPVDWMFRWQRYKNHCERAFYKCLSGEYLPADYEKVSREEAKKFLEQK